MNTEKQVEKTHYDFANYLNKGRWNSIWHQLSELLKLDPKSCLEIGPGLGVLKKVALLFDVSIDTLDLDPDLEPDHVGSATELPFADNSFDVVCAFQVLEHLPYEMSLQAVKEMTRVSNRNLLISLPDAKRGYPWRISLPKFGRTDRILTRPRLKLKEHKFDGQHYWEINKKGYELSRVTKDLTEFCDLVDTYRVFEIPYHRFFVLKKQAT